MRASTCASIFLLAGLAPLACDTAGQRARTGECPEGEECSDLTPDGLYFRGPAVGGIEAGLHITASGGAQSVTALIDEGDERVPFEEPFAATVEEPFSLGTVDAPSVEIVAESEGESDLRIVEDETGELFDVVEVSAADIDRTEVGAHPYSGDDPALYYAEGEPQVVAKLYSSGDSRLVDEGIELSTDVGADVEAQAWDIFSLQDLELGENEITITSSAGDTYQHTIEAVDSIDEIEMSLLFDDDIDVEDIPVEIAAGESGLLCFIGRNSGDAVLGLEWSYDVQGPIEAAQSESIRRCANVTGVEAGEGQLIASAAGEEIQIDVDVVEEENSSAVRYAPARGETLWGATPGRRASRSTP